MFVPPTPIPPVNVVVQNPPGMSEWAKTLLSASVGFVFAMVASIVMEYFETVDSQTVTAAKYIHASARRSDAEPEFAHGSDEYDTPR
jgi:hypothetical protein